jgi:hypothetical protein
VASLVYFVCWVDHPKLTARGGAVLVDQLQIHQDKWAYCSTGGKAGHVWEPIDPLSLVDVQLHHRWRKEREANGTERPLREA